MQPQIEEIQEAEAHETLLTETLDTNPAAHRNLTTQANMTRSIESTDVFTEAAEATNSSVITTAVTTDSIFDTDLPVHAIPDIQFSILSTPSIAPVTTDSALVDEGEHAGSNDTLPH